MRVYPVDGRKIRMLPPFHRRVIGPEGVEVDDHDLHYHRLIACGDLCREPPAAPDAPAATGVTLTATPVSAPKPDAAA